MPRLVLLFALTTCAGVYADTVTLADNRMIHGKLTFHDGRFSLAARWGKDTEKTLTLAPKDVKNVRFNKTTYNPEPPGPELVARSVKAGTKGAAASNPKCETHGSKKLLGDLEMIDDVQVKVGGKVADRNDVMMLLLK